MLFYEKWTKKLKFNKRRRLNKSRDKIFFTKLIKGDLLIRVEMGKKCRIINKSPHLLLETLELKTMVTIWVSF